MFRLSLCVLALGFSALVWAEKAGNEGKSPGDLSADERASMMRVANDYNTCVYNEAMAKIDAHEDIRQIADQAMGQCQGGLDKLDEAITQWGYPSYFAQRFTQNIRDRAVRKLIPELAIRKR